MTIAFNFGGNVWIDSIEVARVVILATAASTQSINLTKRGHVIAVMLAVDSDHAQSTGIIRNVDNTIINFGQLLSTVEIQLFNPDSSTHNVGAHITLWMRKND